MNQLLPKVKLKKLEEKEIVQREYDEQAKMYEQKYLLTIGYSFWGALKDVPQGWISC